MSQMLKFTVAISFHKMTELINVITRLLEAIFDTKLLRIFLFSKNKEIKINLPVRFALMRIHILRTHPG